MTLNCVKLGRAITFMKYLASVVSLIFPQKTWNKTTFLASGGKLAYEEYDEDFTTLQLRN